MLRLYVRAGVGTCEKMPILCASPEQQIIIPGINREYTAGLLAYNFPEIAISLPKGFTAVKDDIKKVYYKKYIHKDKGNIAYLFYKKTNYLVSLFPELTKEGITNDFELVKRTMFAKLNDIRTPNDTFFVILKSISMSYLGDMSKVIMRQFALAEKKGFINYNISGPVNYFDCNIIDTKGNFLKIYIQDRDAVLDLDKVLAIISTIKVRD